MKVKVMGLHPGYLLKSFLLEEYFLETRIDTTFESKEIDTFNLLQKPDL